MLKFFTKKHWLQALAIWLGGLLLLYFVTPNFSEIEEFIIPQQDIKIVEVDSTFVSQRLTRADDAQLASNQFKVWQDVPRQFHYSLKSVPEYKSAIFIPNVGGACRFFTNGIMDEGCEQLSDSMLFQKSYGLYKELKSNYLSSNNNRIDIVLMEDTEQIGIRQVYLGDADKLEKASKNYTEWLSVSASLQVLLCIGFLLISLASFFINEKKGISLLCMASAVVILVSLKSDFFIHRLIVPTLLSVLFGALWLSLKRLNRIKNEGILLGLAFLYATALLCYFLLAGSSFHPSNASYFYSLASWGVFPLLAGVSLIELLRGKESYQQRLEQLQQVVLTQEEDIKRKQDALNMELRKRVILEERQRFTRDIHDGIGSNLLSLLVRLRSKKIDMHSVQEEVESSLHDLRLVVDSLDHTGDDLSSMLVTFKSRIEPQFIAANIQLSWTEEENLLWKPTKTRDILNLYRLIQEAMSNILRHAQAKQVSVQVTQDQDANLEVVIEDDGIGLPDGYEDLHGKGLSNMQYRAKRLNGELIFGKTDSGEGTRISLRVPYYGEPVIQLQ